MRTVGTVSVQSRINSRRNERRRSDTHWRLLCRLFSLALILAALCYDSLSSLVPVTQACVTKRCVFVVEILSFSQPVFKKLTTIAACCRMSSGKAVHSAGVGSSVFGGPVEEDASVVAGGGGGSAEPLSVEDVGVASGFGCEDEVSDIDRYRQAAAQHFASHSDDGAGGEVPNGTAYVAQGSVMYSYHAGSELRIGVANAMGKLTGLTPV